jgi:hypothetical protein
MIHTYNPASIHLAIETATDSWPEVVAYTQSETDSHISMTLEISEQPHRVGGITDCCYETLGADPCFLGV